MDIKKVVFWLIIIMVVSFTVAGISFGSYFGSGVWKADRTTFSDEKALEIKDISKISIKSPSAGLNITTAECNQVKVRCEVTSFGAQAPVLKAETAGSEMRIEFVPQPHIGFDSITERLEIAIPASYSQDLAIEIVSGRTAISNLKLDELTYRGSSGSLRSEDVTAKKADVEVTSGSVRMSGFAGDLQAETSSGRVEVEYREYLKNNVNIKGISGSIQLKLPTESEFALDASTTSGSVNCDFPLTIQGGLGKNHLQGQVGKGGGTVTIRNTSGSININK